VCSGLAEALVKIRVLEDSLAKTTRAIEKSKKAQEVQHLMKENAFLQEKLAFQGHNITLFPIQLKICMNLFSSARNKKLF
jgi:hypothetical protein